MSYNHGRSEKLFAEAWKKLRKEYKEAGMSDEAIEEMYRFDRNVFNRDRAYMEHRHIDSHVYNGASDEDSGDGVYEPTLAVSDDLSQEHSRYWWIEEIENPLILAYIKELSQIDIEIITLCVFEGFEQKAAAEIVGLSPATLCYRFNKIKKNLKNFSDFRI